MFPGERGELRFNTSRGGPVLLGHQYSTRSAYENFFGWGGLAGGVCLGGGQWGNSDPPSCPAHRSFLSPAIVFFSVFLRSCSIWLAVFLSLAVSRPKEFSRPPTNHPPALPKKGGAPATEMKRDRQPIEFAARDQPLGRLGINASNSPPPVASDGRGSDGGERATKLATKSKPPFPRPVALPFPSHAVVALGDAPLLQIMQDAAVPRAMAPLCGEQKYSCIDDYLQ